MRSGSGCRTWVYPRVGGETVLSAPDHRHAAGLSPRGRGNRAAGADRQPAPRSIPAWAGKPRWACSPRCRPWVYPRVGGETRTTADRRRMVPGLSPRGRGNPRPRRRQRDVVRSIPAWAGNLSRYPPGNRQGGSIPAWAGKPRSGRRRSRPGRVYPRVGGETVNASRCRRPGMGLSPRGRGNHIQQQNKSKPRRSIPAWAGKPWTSRSGCVSRRVYPRVGGETISSRTSPVWYAGLSPRGRGNPRLGGIEAELSRSIPAWAGKPRAMIGATIPSGVYPRVGGETISTLLKLRRLRGLSPRGRGNRQSMSFY